MDMLAGVVQETAEAQVQGEDVRNAAVDDLHKGEMAAVS
jgi:hypothetical protein